MRQVDRPPLHQPDDRSRARRPRHRRGVDGRREPPRPIDGRRRHPASGRHGLPTTQPVPEVHLRQRRVRPTLVRHPRTRAQRDRRAHAPRGRALGRGQGQGEAVRNGAVRRPAAAGLHRARDGRRAGGDPDGRAVLGPRPDRDAADRGTDRAAPRDLHDRHRDPQHAAGIADQRPHSIPHDGD